MISITRIQDALSEAGYGGVASDDTANYVCRSPHTRRPIVIPMTRGDSLPEVAIRYVLRDEPNQDELMACMRDGG